MMSLSLGQKDGEIDIYSISLIPIGHGDFLYQVPHLDPLQISTNNKGKM
jgi:hypothetical protein